MLVFDVDRNVFISTNWLGATFSISRHILKNVRNEFYFSSLKLWVCGFYDGETSTEKPH